MEIVTDTLSVAKQQRRKERKNALCILGIVAAAVVLVLLLDSAQWQMETFIFMGVGVILPLFCAFGLLALLGSGIWRKVKGRPCGQTFALALALLLLFIIFMGLFFLIGALGIGPAPN